MSNAFSGTIKFQHELRKWQGAHIIATNISITHSLFVDDSLLFRLLQVQEDQQVKHSLTHYSDGSRQKINAQK